jgi:Zn-dependent peptidase ImmA (M78 family)
MHEFKHILDHTSRDHLYNDRLHTTAEQAERVADYFAACVLMPKRVVKRLWYSGNQNIDLLANMLSVSAPALRYRLNQLGLTERSERCARLPVARPLLRPWPAHQINGMQPLTAEEIA